MTAKKPKTPKGKGPPGHDGPPGHQDPPGVRRGHRDRIKRMQETVFELISQISNEVTTTTNVILQDETNMTEVDREIPIPRSAGDARASQSEAGADTATSATRAFEGTHKQTADTNVEELLSLQSGLSGGNSTFMEAVNRLNGKRSYDQAQSFDLGVQYNDVSHRQRLNQIAEQTLQNAVESANILSKQIIGQVVRHNDLAMDRQWNVDEQGYTVNEILRNETFKDGIAGAVAAAVAATVNK